MYIEFSGNVKIGFEIIANKNISIKEGEKWWLGILTTSLIFLIFNTFGLNINHC